MAEQAQIAPLVDSPAAVACGVVPTSFSRRRVTVIMGLLVFLTAMGSLFFYKWSASLRVVETVRAAGWTRSADAITTGGVLAATLNYFGKVWIALLFGILIGAAVRALVSPGWVAGLLGTGGTLRRQVVGGLAGAPLMLCSCCVTPIFTGVYERGARLGSALSLMLASPGLNLAALVLTFMLFPLNMSLARLGAAVVAVFVLPAILERVFGGTLKPVAPRIEADAGPRNWREFVVRFFKSAGYLALVTLPLLAAGVLLSSLLLPLGLSPSGGGAAISLVVVTAIGVVVALPTFFEIPLAILLIHMGSPGAAAAMLFVGPIVNLPSLLVLGRETNWKVATALGVGIFLLGIAAGAVAII